MVELLDYFRLMNSNLSHLDFLRAMKMKSCKYRTSGEGGSSAAVLHWLELLSLNNKVLGSVPGPDVSMRMSHVLPGSLVPPTVQHSLVLTGKSKLSIAVTADG